MGLPPNLTCGELDVMAQYISNDPFQCNAIRYFFPQCCLSDVPLYICERNIRNKIFSDYDAAIPPIISWREPLNVTFRLQYETVVSIDVQSGVSEIFFSILTYWNDPRLAWEIDNDHCTNEVNAFAGSQDVQKTELWVPDLDLYNKIEGVQNLPDNMAVITSDGTVFWNRFGGISSICQFTGVSQIPFDVLGCQLIFGPLVRINPFLVHYHLYNGTGFSFGTFEPSYNEYVPVPELAESGLATEGTSIFFFNFFFKRAQEYYIFNLIVPTVILTYVSMGTYLLDLRVGERLSYGMALALVVVAQQISTQGTIPISNERLWIDKFIAWSFYWVILGLLESVFVGYLYFLREDHVEASNQMEESSEGGKKQMEESHKKQLIYHGMSASTLGVGPQGGRSPPRQSNLMTEVDKKTDVGVEPQPQQSCQKTEVDEEVDVVVEPLPHQSDLKTEVDEEADVVVDPPPQQSDLKTHVDEVVTTRENTKPALLTSQFKANPDEDVASGGGSILSVTLKQRLTPLKRTRTLRSVQLGIDNDQQAVNKRWRWMYTISLRKLDKFFFFLTLISYSLFLIAMFVSIQYWGKNVDVKWNEGVENA